MLNTILLEIECPSVPKGPPPNKPPQQANPVELKRALAAIATRRKNLMSAHAKLAKSAPGTAAYECQKLRVQAAAAWLQFTTKRWKMMSEYSKANGKKHPETDKLLAFGDVHAEHGEKHLAVAGTDQEHPPLADLEFNHEKGQLYHAGHDAPFEIPEDPHSHVKVPEGAKPKTKKAGEEPEGEEPEAKKAPEPLKKGWHSIDSNTQDEIMDKAIKPHVAKFGWSDIGPLQKQIADKYGLELDHDAIDTLLGVAKKDVSPEKEPEAQAADDAWLKKVGGDHGALSAAGLDDLSTGQQKSVLKAAKEVAAQLDASDFSSSGSLSPNAGKDLAIVLKHKYGVNVADGAAFAVLKHFAKPPSPGKATPAPEKEREPKKTPPAPEAPKPNVPVDELPEHSKDEIEKTLKAGVKLGHFDADDHDTIKGVLSDHGVENPSPALLKQLSAGLAEFEKKTLSPEQLQSVHDKLKAHILQSKSPVLQGAEYDNLVKGALGHAAQEHHWDAITPIHEKIVSDLEHLSPDEVAKLASWAQAKVKSSEHWAGAMGGGPESAAGKSYMLKELKTIAAEMHGKLPSHTAAMDIINSAIENAKPQGKPISSYDEKQQGMVHSLAKQMAVTSAQLGVDYGGYKEKLALQLQHLGTPLSDAAVDLIAQETWAENTHKFWSKLPDDKKAIVKGIAQKAIEGGGSADDIAKAINAAQIVHLDPDEPEGMAAFLKEVMPKKSPMHINNISHEQLMQIHSIGADEATAALDFGASFEAFKDELGEKLADAGFPLEPGSLEHVANDMWDTAKEVKLDSDAEAAEKAAQTEPKEPTTSLAMLRSKVFSTWDHAAGIGEKVNAPSFFILAKDAIAPNVPDEGFHATFGQMEQAWLSSVWNEWYSAYQKKSGEGHPSDSIPTAKGDHPWHMSEYTADEQGAIAELAKDVAANTGKVEPDSSGFNTALAKFKMKLADLGKPLKHADAVEQLKKGLAGAPDEPPPWMQHVNTFTKFKKIGKSKHFSLGQKKYLAEKFKAAVAAGTPFLGDGEIGPKKLAAAAAKIHAEFKEDWAHAGVTQLNKDLIKDMLQKAAEEHKAAMTPALSPIPPGVLVPPGASPESLAAAGWAAPTTPTTPPPAPAPGAPPAPAAAAQPDDVMALFHAMPPGALTDWEKDAIPSIYNKTIAKGKQPSWKQNFALKKFIEKAKKLIPASPGGAPIAKAPDPATGAEEPEVAPTTGAHAHAGVAPEDNPLGMSYEQIKQFASFDKPAGAPAPPPLSSSVWKGKGEFGGGGAHDKQFVGTDAQFNVVSSTFKGKAGAKASHAWMFKGDHNCPFVGYGEVAAARVQTLLGIGKTEHVWMEKDADGVPGVMQHFAAQKSFRDLGEHTPWLDHTKKDKVAKQLQAAVISNWLNDDYDDHDGNFVIDDEANVTPVDHGQSARFFDSSMTLIKKLNWSVPNPTLKGFAHVSQDGGKGFPGKMLRDWAAGKNVPLAALTDPAITGAIAKAEALPSDVYKELWRPYAEGSVKKFGAVAGYSSNKGDQNVEGFLEGMDQRRKTLRKQVGDLYEHLAKTRAASLKANGDARPISTIEAEVRDQIGLDDFLKGKATSAAAKQVDHKVVAKSVIEASENAGWDESKLPVASHLPKLAVLKKHGDAGVDMMVGGRDVKDGRLQFFQLGNNTMATFMLDTHARQKLEARLPGGAGKSVPPAPSPPEIPDFEPPAKPTFKSTSDDLHKKVLDAAGFTSDKLKPDGSKLSKIEKHIDKWRKGETSDSALPYLSQGYKAAEAMAASADPVEKAAGNHYLNEFAKMGSHDGSGFKFKDPSTVSAEDRKSAFATAYEPSKEQLTAQKKAKADVESAYKESLTAAKKAWEEKKADLEASHAKAMKKYEADQLKANEEAAKLGQLPATKLDYYPVPVDVERLSNPSGENKVTNETKWSGKYGKPWDEDANTMSSYELDLTDAVTGVAAAGGKVSAAKKLIVHYVPSETTSGGTRKFPARGGTVRIQYPEGASESQIRDYTQAVSKLLGSDIRPANHKEHELTYLRRMAWLRKIEGYQVGISAASEPEGTADEKIEWWINHFKKPPVGQSGGLGYDPRYEVERTATGQPKKVGGQVVYKKNSDGSHKPNPHYKPEAFDSGLGRLAFNRFDVTHDEMQKWMDQGLTLWKSSLTGDPKWSLSSMINAGGIFSTEKRAHTGMMPKKTGGKKASDVTAAGGQAKAVTGLSSSADVGTGGSNEVFLFIGKNSHDSGWGHFDPRLLLLTSAWHHAGDHYGAKAGHSVTGRTGSVQEERPVTRTLHTEAVSSGMGGTHNEVLVGDRIPFWNWVTRLNVTKNGLDKKEFVKKLKAAGITHAGPDKKPIEEVLV